MMKRTLGLGVTCAFLLTSCGSPSVDTSLSSDKVLSDARATYASEMMTNIDNTSDGTATFTLAGNIAAQGISGDIKADVTSNMIRTDEKQEVASDMKLNVNLKESPIGEMTATVAGSLIAGMEDLYIKASELTVDIANEQYKAQIESMLPMIQPYLGDWYVISQEALQQQGGAVALQTFTVDDLKLVLETYKTTPVFNVKETLPPENGMYVYKVGLESEGIITLIEKFLEVSKAPAVLTEDEKTQISEAISSLNNSPLEMTVYVDSAKMRFAKFTVKGSMEDNGVLFALAFEGKSPEMNKGSIDLLITGKEADSELLNLALKASGDTTKQEGTLVLKGPQGIDMNMSFTGDFEKGSVEIETPTDAIDLVSLVESLNQAGASQTTVTEPVVEVDTTVEAE